jgi:hypothetical protein
MAHLGTWVDEDEPDEPELDLDEPQLDGELVLE